jgi:uncharacterized membrane protein YphA (DoxX/SURF4 family)
MRDYTVAARSYRLRLSRIILGAVFISAALTKFRQPYDFFASVSRYGLLDRPSALAVAELLPWIELVLGVALLAGVLIPGAFATSLCLLIAFAGIRGWALAHGLEISCGCFTGSVGQIGYSDLAVSIGLTGLAAWGLFAAIGVAPPRQSMMAQHQEARS